MENASGALLDAVRKSMRQFRRVFGAMTINPDLLTAVGRLQFEEYLPSEDTSAAIFGLAKEGIAIRQIV